MNEVLTTLETELLKRLRNAIQYGPEFSHDGWWSLRIEDLGNDPWIPGVLGSLTKKGLYCPDLDEPGEWGWVQDPDELTPAPPAAKGKG